MKIRKVDGFWNYDKSEFEKPSAIFDNDDAIEEVWKQQHALSEKTDPSNFKSYDELKKRLDTVLAGTTTVGNVADVMEDEPVAAPTVDTKPVEMSVAPAAMHKAGDKAADDEDESIDYFQKLASEG